MGDGWNYRWWVGCPFNRFAFEVYAIREYPALEDNEGFTVQYHQEFLSPEGCWVSFPLGGVVEPVLTVDRRLMSVIRGVVQIDKDDVVEMLHAILERVPLPMTGDPRDPT